MGCAGARGAALNPQGFDGLTPWLAFNTAVSFVTNTNWQACSGESALSYFPQMAGLTVQNFLSAATGMALALAVSRAFARGREKDLGDSRADLVRRWPWGCADAGALGGGDDAGGRAAGDPAGAGAFQIAIPFGLALTFGAIVGDIRQGRALLLVMLACVLAGTWAVDASEAGAPGASRPRHRCGAGNTKGEELRFGRALVALFTPTTTGASLVSSASTC